MKSQGFLFANGKVEIVSLLSSFAKFFLGGVFGERRLERELLWF